MKTTVKLFFFVLSAIMLVLTSCSEEPDPNANIPASLKRDQVFKCNLYDVRLGDGVPLSLGLSVRWSITDYQLFKNQFNTANRYDSLILYPRQLELSKEVANEFPSVDSVFSTWRYRFIDNIKSHLTDKLGEDGVVIKEVIVSNVNFPSSYTQAKEQVAMHEQELERIRQKNLVDLESAIAAEQKAKADGQVTMAQAEMDAKVEKINAETEKSRRQNTLAQAETEKQVSRMKAEAEAERKKLLAKADLEKRRDQDKQDVQKKEDLDLAAVNKQRNFDEVALEKQKGLEELAMEKELKIANICATNPTYANFIVNKELASKVQIAVLPSSGDASVFQGLLNNGLAKQSK